MNVQSKGQALQILKQDAEKIYSLINSQKEHLCYAACPAFEEVVDTQLFGLSKQIDFAIQLGVLGEEEGHQIIADLETSLNRMYSDYFKKHTTKPQREGGI
ncbi:DUF1507 family protein [Jeotgalibaca ciconiae]|uniref:DUF1507 family protein n=1 Tax=Jeotgalibaca ciconiae TaxID=2496265 RepID=A0A3S9HCU2_9LACT|nr:DUF1507 family protein [Jeotgalibaca ciconiae]AZP05169.1 DUF1507 family protein [Jeotgalibaca ciconiae]HJB22856.1 YlaN family protein [Candidatus Jeotgalibaca pullicola]